MLVSEVQMVAFDRLLPNSALLVHRFEPESVIDVQVGLLHWNHIPILVYFTEPLRFYRVNRWVPKELHECDMVQTFEPLCVLLLKFVANLVV